MKRLKKLFYLLLAGLALLLLAILLINFYISQIGEKYIFESATDASSAVVSIILGARVYKDGSMSDMLKDRVLTALELYENGTVKKLLASGDHGGVDYDEVNTIKDFLLENGVTPGDIFLDHAGMDTYDSMYRARDIFKIKSAIVVTQAFHLPRAVYLGRSLGVGMHGVIADRQLYLGMARAKLREKLAIIKAFLNILFRSKPKFLGDAIPISGDGRLSWD